jgi:hypothetical protein
LIKAKEKICKGCNLSKRLFSKGLCLSCYKKTHPYKIKTLKPINKVSSKQQQIIRKYSLVRKEFLLAHPTCTISLPDCTRKATEVHHSGKKFSEETWLDTSLFISCCRNCHNQIEASPELAKKLGIYNYKL